MILSWIRQAIRENHERQEKQFAAQKAHVVDEILREWDYAEVWDWNTEIIAKHGWFGGHYTEAEIKLRILNENCGLFSAAEFAGWRLHLTQGKILV